MSGIQLRRPVAKSGHGRSFSEGSRKVDEPIDGLMQEFRQLKDASTGKTQCKPSEKEEIRALKIRACDLALQLSGEMPQQQLEVLRGVVANLERHVAGQSQHQDKSREYDQQVSQLNLEGLTVEDDASSMASDPTIASLVEADRILWIKHKVWDTYMEYEGTAPRYFPDCGPFEVKILPRTRRICSLTPPWRKMCPSSLIWARKSTSEARRKVRMDPFTNSRYGSR
ncbi:hypothetical protein MCOR02_003612 [Pyricularia oryzae]|nr:hypothetical protein MCOR02_003612 [Pyricularia oryzae]KAI6274544.1 hypothetical protein MCOR34_011503 [Pyricularia oryzae]KAI6445296.1 hypothetical protein MCOR17_010999 [Pyricularia oryzae]KAI6479125.1 hypothetical protein MCOR13_011539 [Pyricularia oryzae]KAI6551140.1 hypothetical protein MCOR04_011125 [Pyricularia oryzae]